MPIYEFICRDCHTDFEKLVPASMRDKVDCPDCGSQKTARKVSLAAPAQVRSGAARSSGMGCELPNCCGGSCGIPN